MVIVAPFLFMDGEPEGAGVATDPTSPSASATVVEDGVRTESWHEMTFEVPDTWGQGGTSAWCSSGRSPEDTTPTVGRPTDMVALILCDPGNGYGVTVGSGAAASLVYDSGHVWQYDTEGVDHAEYPDGAWLSYWYDDDTLITIVTPDRRAGRADPQVCTPHRPRRRQRVRPDARRGGVRPLGRHRLDVGLPLRRGGRAGVEPAAQ
jgi:hypothetical protein